MDRTEQPLCGTAIALVGAECTGKSTLATALVQALKSSTGQTCALVPETLREWCEVQGRTPNAHEQLGILQEHHRRIAAAKAGHAWVVCDTSGLMTAVYSQFIFGDESLLAQAQAAHQRDIEHTLLMALDLPWQADGLQRDGPQVRRPVDQLLRQALVHARISFSVVHGEAGARLEQALAALPLRSLATLAQAPTSAEATNLNAQRTLHRQAKPSPNGAWQCACCSVPQFERLLASGAD